MNTEKDEDIDKLFKNGLEDPVNESAFREADWDAMEQLLDKDKKRPVIIFWLPVVGSAAALIVIFIGYLFLNPEAVKPGKKDQVATVHPADTGAESTVGVQTKNKTGTSGEPVRQAADSSEQKMHTVQYAVTPSAHPSNGKNGKSFFPLSPGKDRRDAAGGIANNINDGAGSKINKTTRTNNLASAKAGKGTKVKTGAASDIDQADDKIDQNGNVIATNVSPVNTTGVDTAGNKTEAVNAGNKAGLEPTDDKNKQKNNIADNKTVKMDTGSKLKVKGLSRGSPHRPVFAFGVLASSDLNGVNSPLQQSRVGGNFGATLSVTFAKKWTISSGASYDIKPYLTSFSNYRTNYYFVNQPSSVNADCRMLDIPININYQVYSHRANNLSLGTGLSSYFMLRESYKFNYADSYATGPAGFTVTNQNHNILSVLNLDAIYTHQINSKIGVTVQPYLKVPLSNVGASQVRLQSTGVALGLSWNINAYSKPK